MNMKLIRGFLFSLVLIQSATARADVSNEMFPVVSDDQWLPLFVRQGAIVSAESAAMLILQKLNGPEVDSIKKWNDELTSVQITNLSLKKALNSMTVDPKLRAMRVSLETAKMQIRIEKAEQFVINEKAAQMREPTDKHQTLLKMPEERTADENFDLVHQHRYSEAELANVDHQIASLRGELNETIASLGGTVDDIEMYPIKSTQDVDRLNRAYKSLEYSHGHVAISQARDSQQKLVEASDAELENIKAKQASIVAHNRWFLRAFRLASNATTAALAVNIAAQLTLIYQGRDPGLFAARAWLE